MVEITGTSITMTRGDTLVADVSMVRQGSEYTPETGDVILFAVKNTTMVGGGANYKDEEPILEKVIPNSTLQLVLQPEDTKPLKFGTYVYDISITFADGSVDTFITTSDFILTPEVG